MRKLTPREVSDRAMAQYEQSGGVMKDFRVQGYWAKLGKDGMEYFHNTRRIPQQSFYR